jgi:hypothetical protein
VAQLKRFFASGKITPVNTGTEAWETAGRRLGPLSQQTATGVKEEAALQAKVLGLGRYIYDERVGRGGGGGGGRGSVHDALDFGRGFDNGYAGAAENENTVNGGPQAAGYATEGYFNSRAHTEISNGAAQLGDLASALGQQVEGGYVGLYGDKGIKPIASPDPTKWIPEYSPGKGVEDSDQPQEALPIKGAGGEPLATNPSLAPTDNSKGNAGTDMTSNPSGTWAGWVGSFFPSSGQPTDQPSAAQPTVDPNLPSDQQPGGS